MSHLSRKFTTIMWKNITVRRRHWFMTLLEICIPIALFYLLNFIHNKINQVPLDSKIQASSTTHNPKSESEILELFFINHDVVNIAYTPENEFTTKIITKVKEIIEESVDLKTRPFRSGNGTLNITHCESEEELEQYFTKIFGNTSENNYMGYGIVFTDTNTKNFHYKLRSTASSWETERLFSDFSRPGGQSDQYLYQGFLALQLAVDKAFIEVVTNAAPKYQIVLQQFPDPATDLANTLITVYKIIIPLFTMLSFIFICPSLLKKIVEEKLTGIKELMKMVGLKQWMIWTGWMINSMMVYIVTCIVITFLLCSNLSGRGAVITYTHWSLIFVMFALFCATSVAFTFAISSFFYKPTIAMTVGMLIWIVSYFLLINYDNTVMSLQMVMCAVPTIAIRQCLSVILIFEKNRETLVWSKIFYDGLGGHGNGMSLGLVFGLFILDIVIYTIIAWYVDALIPGPYGRAKPWYFIFQWAAPRNKKDQLMSHHQEDEDEQHFESPPREYNVGISIRNLRKVFSPNVVAVDKVNLEIYEGQITALLGHNGAGKTTTMSILTGMFSPSSGSVYVNNYNIFERMDDFRSSLGLCPQYNLLFSYLNVMEHLIFFAMLKGLSYSEGKNQATQLLQLLNILDKKNVMVEKLSGGMKRKLSLAIALIGNPKVLMLDEPTSGMDPESRRELWDLLLRMRGERTIIITTHFMEEADVLGDRIAIMDHGRVRCYGTTIFLKKLYGTGYQLTIMKEPSAKSENITNVIQDIIDGAELKSSYSSQVTYSLPQENSTNFPNLFLALEEKKSVLGIKGLGIACTTMEEVFLKVGESTKDEHVLDKISLPSRDHTIHRHNSDEALTYKKVKGLALVLQQFSCLIKKKALYTKRKWISSLAFVILPLFMLLTTVKVDVLNIFNPESEPALDLELSKYAYISPDTFIASNQNGNQLPNIFKQLVTDQGSSVTEIYNKNIVDELIKESTANIEHYERQMIVAAEFNSTTAKGLFSSIPLHATPIIMNLITQSILQSNPKTSSNRIFITNHPLNIYSASAGKCIQPKGGGAPSGLSPSSITIAFLWLSLVPQGLLFLASDFIAFPLAERVCNAKQIQLMTGVHHVVYWLSCFVWDYFLFIWVTLSMVIVILLADPIGMFSDAVPLGVFALIVLLFGISGLSYAYFFSYTAKTSPSATSIFLIVNTIFGIISSVIMYFLLIYADNFDGPHPFISPWVVYLINYILLLNPHYALIGACMKYAVITFDNYMCNACIKQNPSCKSKSYFSYDKEDKYLGLNMTYLALDWILYYALILLIDYGYMSIFWHKVKALWIGRGYDSIEREDSDVKEERDRVDAAKVINGGGNMQTVLTANGLVKKFSRNFAAVKGVSFQVAPGECFGLLGVNGAGKTTTFRMLTGDEIPTGGEASICNYTLADHRTKYLKQIGYCPQFDGINEVLTGEEMLTLFALLRGIPSKSVSHQVNDWIILLGLEEYRNRPCGSYSGGNKRKLCTALSLIGDPPVVFLDEPTSGVDPVSRRNLWDVLARCQKAGQAIVLTSHSMEECEALCTRLTIMVKGRMMCIGSTQYIKQRYGQGYTIMIKLFSHSGTDLMLPQLKQEIQSIFASNCILKDEHKGLLHYHVTDSTIRVSYLFSSLERLKTLHTIIEDYTVSDTTLEQVFIAFAKQQ